MVLYSGLLLYKHIHTHRIIMSLQMPWKALQTEQTWTTHKSDKCTYIYHQKLHCTVLILKRRGICERVTLSLFAEIVQVQQPQSSKRIITFGVKIYHLFSLNHHVWFTANCLRVLKVIYIYTKINHQLFSAHSFKKGRRGACMEIIIFGHKINALSLNKSAK